MLIIRISNDVKIIIENYYITSATQLSLILLKLNLINYVHKLFCKDPFKNSGNVFIYFQFKFLQRYEIVLKISSFRFI